LCRAGAVAPVPLRCCLLAHSFARPAGARGVVGIANISAWVLTRPFVPQLANLARQTTARVATKARGISSTAARRGGDEHVREHAMPFVLRASVALPRGCRRLLHAIARPIILQRDC